ncbi:MAG: hypothetical protein HY718_19335 [Planctomycetes bacterium]|nr:hypothetical protein [Planctomycetota bacterium]
MLEIVDLFRDKGTVDELGFGSIRDAFSDHFFPGTSTIYTRARYLLFVPWIYLRIERDHIPYSQLDGRARRDQAALARALQHGGEGDAQGVIGIQAGETLERTPAAIYWTGLKRFRIWRFPGSMAQYYAAVRRAGPTAEVVRSDDGELVERTAIPGWHTGLPKEPPGLLECTTLSLTAEEAEYLRERITVEAPGSLLAFCVDGGRRISRIDYPWLHPDPDKLPTQLRTDLGHAHRFSVAAYGAALLYNLMLAEKAAEASIPIGESLVDRRRHEIQVWASRDPAPRALLRGWRMSELWSTVLGKGHEISHGTRQFVEDLVAIMQVDPGGLADHTGARRTIERRELALKGGLARLTHRRALERFFNGSTGSAGLYEQTYRWPNVKRILADIHAGLAHKDAPEEQPDA